MSLVDESQFFFPLGNKKYLRNSEIVRKRKGKERKGKERKGKERKGKERKEKKRKEKKRKEKKRKEGKEKKGKKKEKKVSSPKNEILLLSPSVSFTLGSRACGEGF
jgi:chromatin remodeling complex protein RSC6